MQQSRLATYRCLVLSTVLTKNELILTVSLIVQSSHGDWYDHTFQQLCPRLSSNHTTGRLFRTIPNLHGKQTKGCDSFKYHRMGHGRCLYERKQAVEAGFLESASAWHSGGQRKRYTDMLLHNLKACSIDPKELRGISRGQIIVACDVQSFSVTRSQNESQRWRRSDPYVKQAGDRQLAALLASRVATSVLNTAELILIGDQRPVVLDQHV